MAKKITIDSLAEIIAREFSNVHKEIKEFREENESQYKQIRRDIGNLEFIATEMIRKEEFMALLKRVERLETRLKA